MTDRSLGEAVGLTPASPVIPPRKPTPIPKGWVLTGEGFRREGSPEASKDTDFNVGELFLATVYLKSSWVPAKCARQGSYWLKHEVERHTVTHPGRYNYCSNGALIRAALNLGFRVEPIPGSVNAEIYLKRPPDWEGPRCERDGCWPVSF